MTDLLAQNGYLVNSAADGALARLELQARLPDLVILDLMLPDVSGFSLIAEWRKDAATAGMPIFVLTNKDLSPEEKEYLHANTGAMFSKHGEWRDELIRQIQRIAPVLAEV